MVEKWRGLGGQAVVSYDRRHWFRTRTTYDTASGALSIYHTPKSVRPAACVFSPHHLHTELRSRHCTENPFDFDLLVV